MSQKPSLPKGTRDFGPEQMAKRNYILHTIKNVFERFGFMPLETPAMENLSVLTGKYGDEGDQLLFKILNSGDFLSKVKRPINEDAKSLTFKIAEKGLKYDLTVPFARYVVMNRHNITLPFKRYQIQPVWRADRPQKGRYREFFQCDADVIGTDSLVCEAEIILMMNAVLNQLKIDSYTIKINNRKVLQGLANVSGLGDSFTEMTVAIDKLDKIGFDGVLKEMKGAGMEERNARKVLESLEIDSIEEMEKVIGRDSAGRKGLDELKKLYGYLEKLKLRNKLSLDVSLARGLDYYTGCILEVVSNEADMGSLGGGGRYDDLTGIFGLSDMSGVGISFGAERIYDIMEEMSLFPESVGRSLNVFFMAMDEDTHKFAFSCVARMREEGIAADIYPEPVKLKKQMKHADELDVPFTVIIGSNEQSSGLLTIKDMKSGTQEQMTLDRIIEKFKK